MNRNEIEKAIWWAYLILLFAIVVVKFKGSFAELRDRITLYSSQEAVIFNLIPFRNIGVQIKHYMDVFHAEYLGMLHQYQFFIDEEQAKNLLEVYHYEWNET